MYNVGFPRKPYTVTYYKDGKKVEKKRTPPPKLHPLLAGDKVTITRKKGDNWKDGDEVEVKGINPRQPNTLQVEKSNGKTTFLPFFDVAYEGDLEPVETPADSKSGDQVAQPRRVLPNKYLQWP